MVTLSREDLKKIANDSVLDILKSLSERNKTLSELAEETDISKSTAHFHLEKLKKTDLIEVQETDNKWKYYQLTSVGKKIINGNEIKLLIIKYFPLIVSATAAMELIYFISEKLTDSKPNIGYGFTTTAQNNKVLRSNGFFELQQNVVNKGNINWIQKIYQIMDKPLIDPISFLNNWITNLSNLIKLPETHLTISVILLIIAFFIGHNLKEKYYLRVLDSFFRN